MARVRGGLKRGICVFDSFGQEIRTKMGQNERDGGDRAT